MSAALAIEAARAKLAEMHGAGASIAARRNGRAIFATGIGFRDLARTQPYAHDDPAWIYSITKPLIAARVLQRAHASEISLDAPTQQYAPDLNLPEDVTIARLLNHTAGLTDYGDLPAYYAALRETPAAPWSDAEFLARTVHARAPRFAPGQGFAYSNIGYLILRQILESSGETLGAQMQRAIFAPLGLKHARLAQSPADCANLPPGWSRALGDAAPEDVSRRYHPHWVSHRAAIATAEETAIMLDAILDARLISAAARDRMLQATPVGRSFPPFTQPSYGLGLMIDQASPFGRALGHSGGGPGFSCAAYRFTDIDTTIVALANSDEQDFGAHLVFAMADALSKPRAPASS